MRPRRSRVSPRVRRDCDDDRPGAPGGARSRCAAWSSASARSRRWTGSTSRCPTGVCFGLLGPNGAGKSTTMRMLTAQALADEGEISVLGYELPRESKQSRLEMGVVPQLDNLDVELTCRQILTVFARLYRVPRAERAAAVERALEIANLRAARGHDRARALRRHAPAAARRARPDPPPAPGAARRAHRGARPAGAPGAVVADRRRCARRA